MYAKHEFNLTSEIKQECVGECKRSGKFVDGTQMRMGKGESDFANKNSVMASISERKQ